ncbi:MAG: hypothetical protein JST40_06845 [Armatimonadetes bacterium]|nr:hypothetical protein [Armatimonadota bacterium]
MDPFGEDRHELTGSLISLEFGPGGRIHQLWASDPALPDEGEDFQFVLPQLAFGEELTEDLFPGTILISARTNPDEPWITSRNGPNTRFVGLGGSMDEEEEEEFPFPSSSIEIQYDLPFLPELQARGRFFEVAGTIPQIVWELELKNISRKVIEIGELGFPLALNNFYDGFGWTDDQLKRLWTSRVYIHQFIGGAASWVFAQRMTAEPPGLLIFPGENTGWEFFAHIPSSLNTPHQWEGIPVVYIHSRATIEREGWSGWWNQHTTLILEAGDSRTFQMRFVPTERDKQDGVSQTLAACGRPTIRVLPGAVAPRDVGIALEVHGTVPSRFFLSKDAQVETDYDEEGGFCFVKPNESGPVRVTFEDKQGRLSHAHLMFTEPIEDLVNKRANWIVENQVCRDKDSALYNAIVLANYGTGEKIIDAEEYAGASGIECSLADALFLAEKNTIYPNRNEIKVLDAYIRDFLMDDVQNPGDMSVGSMLELPHGVGSYAGRPLTYPDVFNLYHSMYRVASLYGETIHRPKVYLKWAAETINAMFTFGWRHYVRTVGVLGYARVYEILKDLEKERMQDELNRIRAHVDRKADEMVKQEYPYAGESVLDTSGFEEVHAAALYSDNDEHLERTMRCSFAARSLAPSWWWYGSDKRSWDGADSTPLRALIDRGEACLAHTTIPNSGMFFAQLDRDYLAIPEAYMRLAFGGMLGPWSLVRNDGAVSMCYCPDLSSRNHGYNPYTGASGLGYFHYLRAAAAYVLPNRSQGIYSFGCHFDQNERQYMVKPWDGVGRRIVLRQIGVELSTSFGVIRQMHLDIRKRWADIWVHNPSDKNVKSEIRIKGLWGTQINIQGRTVEQSGGLASSQVDLQAGKTVLVSLKVVR